MQSQHIQIQREIFHENSLSPLIFCAALIPLANKLNRADCGYQVHGNERKISHFLYMDDLKLPCRSEDNLENEIKIVKAISIDIKMYFGLEKCKNMSKKKGRVHSKIYVGGTFEDIKELDPREVY